jgi:hypothetical protein
MKKIVLILLMLLMNMPVFAFDELREIKNALSELHRPEMRAKLPKFILSNKDASQKDSKRMKLLDHANEIIFYDLSKKYDARPEDYEQKITNKKDRELYKTILDLNRKRSIRVFLLCKGSEDAARKSADKSWELRRKKKDLDPMGVEAIAIDEQMLEECKYDDTAIWDLLGYYGYKQYREKYNMLMLRIIQEDQIEYNYSTEQYSDEMNDRFKKELQLFLASNSLDRETLLTKDQIRLIGEAALTKHQAAFDLKGFNETEQARYVVLPMVVLSMWMERYGLNDLRERFIAKFFVGNIVMDTLKVYSDTAGFKEHIEYLEKKKS